MMKPSGGFVQRGFSLIEIMAVVAILGIAAGMAVPNLTAMVQHYRALEESRHVLSAVTEARGLAQRENLPVELAVFENAIELRLAVVSGTPEQVRRTVTGFTVHKRTPFNGVKMTQLQLLNSAGVTTSTLTPGVGSTTAVLRFCASSDNYLRNAADVPICGIGNLASSNARLVFKVINDTFSVRVGAAMATVNMKTGAT